MRNVEIQTFSETGWEKREDLVAEEEPLQITVDGFPVAVVMRTSGNDEELVKGFLTTEGLVSAIRDIRRIDLDAKANHALVFLEDGVEFNAAKLSRNLFSASSCGICGKASIEAVHTSCGALESDFQVRTGVLFKAPEVLRAAQKAFEQTGGLHGVALFDAEGRMLVLREDVGRHNAVDKVVGWGMKAEVDFGDVFLLVSGRVSFEVMQKALMVGIPLVAAISAPTSLAVDFALESGQGLVGFLRPPKMNVYAGAERVTR